jgi:2,4-dienoyl-CoA reductase-like NADH-dependent reductase (Old Yellow Enzyme family)
MAELNSALQVGDFTIKNRLVLAPLTRARSGVERIPNDLMVEYYQQRANAGLIITEATVISPKAVGYANTPGLWSQEQAQAWNKIVEAVHAQGSKIVVQLWHVGRISHPDLLDGDIPVAPSAIQPAGEVSLLRPKRPFVTPRALSHEEIQEIVAQYKHAAELAKAAGFDGVELHAANGYLIDQFLQSTPIIVMMNMVVRLKIAHVYYYKWSMHLLKFGVQVVWVCTLHHVQIHMIWVMQSISDFWLCG